MGVPLTEDQFGDLFLGFARTAFRLELQPAYQEPVEAETLARYLAGQPQEPTEVPEIRQYFELVRQMTAAGRHIERVRIHEDPPTPYQRWERWVGGWNIVAGESIHYLTRQQAKDVGLLPAAGHDDWWLFDSARLVVMRFDARHHRISTELATDQASITRARAWRDLAVHAATGKRPATAA